MSNLLRVKVRVSPASAWTLNIGSTNVLLTRCVLCMQSRTSKAMSSHSLSISRQLIPSETSGPVFHIVLDSNQDWCWNPVKLPPWCPKPHKHKLRYCNIDILDSKGMVSTSWDIFLCYLNLTFFLACQPHLVVVVLVSVKISLQGKCFLTALLLTLEWFLTTVSHHVNLQRTLLSESAGTSMLGAFKRLFSTVNP